MQAKLPDRFYSAGRPPPCPCRPIGQTKGMKESPKPRPRWFRFSLRTMLVLVTLLCIYLGWAANWKRQRREWLDRSDVALDGLINNTSSAPWPLRPLGESGVRGIFVNDRALIDESQRLFPEAKIVSSGSMGPFH